MLIVIFYRLFFSIFIIRFPLFGALLAAISEFIDLNLLKIFEKDALGQYQFLDKNLDLFYLGLEAFVASTWSNALVRNTALALFTLRFIGTLLFFITKLDFILVLFPNTFEWFYLIYLLSLFLFKKDFFSTKRIVFYTVIILTIPKLVHEYYLHVFLPDKLHPELFQDILLRSNLLFK